MPSDPKKAFRTHRNYLHAFSAAIVACYMPTRLPQATITHEVLQEIASHVRNSTDLAGQKERGQKVDPDLDLVRGAIRNAWGTELLLALAGEQLDDKLVGIANNWAVVQAYYACSHASHALRVAKGQSRPQSHAGTLRAFAELWTKRRTSASLLPWSMGFKLGVRPNLPPDYVPRRVHNLAGFSPSACWDIIIMALRTTRQDDLKERIEHRREEARTEKRKKWQQEECRRLVTGRRPRGQPLWWNTLPRLSKDQRAKIDDDMAATTLLDYLCRLRLRCNYDDPTMFTDGPETPRESRMVHQFLCGITSATLLVHELYIGRVIGWGRLRKLASEWLSFPTIESLNLGLGARRDILLGS